MKKLLTLILLLAACSGSAGRKEPLDYYRYADTWNWQQYNNKEIDHIKYVKYGEMSGDVVLIFFKDGSTLRIYAYKYTMRVRNGGIGSN